jgi:hypothetical protein
MSDAVDYAIKHEKFERKNRKDYERVLHSTIGNHKKSLSISSKVNHDTNVPSETGSIKTSILFRKNNSYIRP